MFDIYLYRPPKEVAIDSLNYTVHHVPKTNAIHTVTKKINVLCEARHCNQKPVVDTNGQSAQENIFINSVWSCLNCLKHTFGSC